MQREMWKWVLVLPPVVPDTQQVLNLKNDRNFQKCRQIHIGVLSPHWGLFWNHRCWKYLELMWRIGNHIKVCMVSRTSREASVCSCCWSLSGPLSLPTYIYVWILGTCSELHKMEDHFHFHLKMFSHYFISTYWTGQTHLICEHRTFFGDHLYCVFFPAGGGVWCINCLCFWCN